MKMWTRAAMMLLATLAVLCCAQSTVPAAAGEAKAADTVSFESSVDLIVRDRHGHIIRDLQPGEIQITDALLEGPLESLQRARKQVYKFQEPFSVSTDKYRVDVAIADENAAKLSTNTIDPAATPEIDERDWANSAADQLRTNPATPAPRPAVVKLEEKEGFQKTPAKIGLVAPPQLIPGAVKPGDAELSAILDGARQRIGEYKRRLPNFVCLMATKRFVDSSGRGLWKLDDSYTSALRYDGSDETTILVDLNGKHVRRGDPGGFDGASVRGEFGETLSMIFSDRAQAQIAWIGMAEVLGARTHVLHCAVRARNSEYAVVANRSWWMHAAYHAFVYIDAGSLCVRRLTVAAEDIPSNFPIKESGLSVDYDYIPIAGQEYLLPVQATLLVRIGRRYLRKNEIEFQNYHKYTAESNLRLDSAKSR